MLFVKILDAVLSQLTISNIAALFTIISSLATVVAAIGAIIVVFVTKRIAEKQLELADQQNKISDKQADISERQNNIALLEQRISLIRDLTKFFEEWYLINAVFEASQQKRRSALSKNSQSELCKKAVLVRTCVKPSKKLSTWELFDYINLQSDQIDYDIKMIDRTCFLFKLDLKNDLYLMSIKDKYITATSLITIGMQDTESETPVCSKIDDFVSLLEKGKSHLLLSLEQQTKLAF